MRRACFRPHERGPPVFSSSHPWCLLRVEPTDYIVAGGCLLLVSSLSFQLFSTTDPYLFTCRFMVCSSGEIERHGWAWPGFWVGPAVFAIGGALLMPARTVLADRGHS